MEEDHEMLTPHMLIPQLPSKISISSMFYYYPLFAFLGWALIMTVFWYISPALSHNLFPQYRKFSPSMKIAWDNRNASSTNATLNSLLCLYALCSGEQIHQNPLQSDEPIVRISCSLILGYFVADFYMMIKYYAIMGDPLHFLHHSISALSYFFVMTEGVMPFFAAFRMTSELSTPFVNLRWAFDAIKYDKSKWPYLINGVCLTFVFFVCRIGIIIPYWYKLYSVLFTKEYYAVEVYMPIMIATCMLLEAMNIFWMWKLARGAVKTAKLALKTRRKSKEG